MQRDDAWAESTRDRLLERMGRQGPRVQTITLDAHEAPAVVRRLADRDLSVGDLCRHPDVREEVLPVRLDAQARRRARPDARPRHPTTCGLLNCRLPAHRRDLPTSSLRCPIRPPSSTSRPVGWCPTPGFGGCCLSVGRQGHQWDDCGMRRTRLSTTVNADLLERKRAAEVDASYSAYDEHPLDEPDAWGDWLPSSGSGHVVASEVIKGWPPHSGGAYRLGVGPQSPST